MQIYFYQAIYIKVNNQKKKNFSHIKTNSKYKNDKNQLTSFITITKKMTNLFHN